MSHIGKCVAARCVRPVIKYQHKFESTYLYGSYSHIDGDSFVWEINGVDSEKFEAYLNALSRHRPNEYKILIIDNAGFHSTKNMKVPKNIHLLNIPTYAPELNPCEQIWQYLKTRFKNKMFQNMENLRSWMLDISNTLDTETIKSITGNHYYLNVFYEAFNT